MQHDTERISTIEITSKRSRDAGCKYNAFLDDWVVLPVPTSVGALAPARERLEICNRGEARGPKLYYKFRGWCTAKDFVPQSL